LTGETYVIERTESGRHHRPEESHLPKHSVNARRLGGEDNRNRAIGSRESGTLSTEYSGSMGTRVRATIRPVESSEMYTA